MSKKRKNKQDKLRNLWNNSIDNALEKADTEKGYFQRTPVSPKEFFEQWLKQPLFPEQYRIIDQIFTNNYQDWNTKIKEILLLWGEGASKDYTVVRTLVYCSYWLTCLTNPQEYFKIGSGTPIVVACMSVNEEHAKSVFFKQFTTCLKKVRNPATGGNYFKEIGVDLRDGKDIQTRKVLLPNHIEAYALDACLHGSEEILTNKGYMPIGKIVNQKLPVKVLSYNFKAKKTEWKKIKYYFKDSKEDPKWMKIQTSFKSSKHRGSSFICTNDHKILNDKGREIRAKDIKKGEKIVLSKPDLNDKQYQMLLGSLIGDAHLTKDNILQIAHGCKQRKYLEYLKKSFSPFSSSLSKDKVGGYGGICNNIYLSSLESLRKVKATYTYILPKLNYRGAAIWYCDDGNLSKDNMISISLYYPLTSKEKDFIVDWFKKKGYKSAAIRRYKSTTKKYSDIRLVLNVRDSLKFLKKIASFIPSCMNYKLPQPYQNINKKTLVKYKRRPSIAKVTKTEYIKKRKGRMHRYSYNNIYNIEVEGNHNFFANGVLVSNSRYSGEGKNILISIFDEIAEVRYDRAKERYENIKHTVFSRFPQHHKVVMISYPRQEFDFMMSHYNEVEEWSEEDRKQVFKSRKAPWDVRAKEGAHPDLIKKRLYKLKEDYAPIYRKNSEDAKRRYECKFSQTQTGRFIKKYPLILDKCINFNRSAPYVAEDKENEIYLTEKQLLNVVWQPWFKPNYSREAYQIEQQLIKDPNNEKLNKKLEKELERHENCEYFIHIDLSQGIEDCAGLALIHPYKMTPNNVGFYTDLAIQIRPDDREINFEDIRKFIFSLDSKGFELNAVTLDGFQSVDFRQIIEREGIQSDIISVDRSRKPYDTLKSLLYQGKINMYNYLVLLRELKELLMTQRGKVDHPVKSSQRLREEGKKYGSKDVSDALAGAIYSAILQESDVGPTSVSMEEINPNADDLLDNLP